MEAEKAAKEAAEGGHTSPKMSGKGGKKGGGKDSKARSSPKAKSPAKSVSPKSPKKSTSPKSGKGKNVSKPSTPTVMPTVESPAPPSKPDEPQPGDDNWEYVDDKLDPRMAKIMCDHWDVVEGAYIDGSKHVFRKIRTEREQIIRYFFNSKSNFKQYLRRPDTKQLEVEFFIKVSIFSLTKNSVD